MKTCPVTGFKCERALIRRKCCEGDECELLSKKVDIETHKTCPITGFECERCEDECEMRDHPVQDPPQAVAAEKPILRLLACGIHYGPVGGESCLKCDVNVPPTDYEDHPHDIAPTLKEIASRIEVLFISVQAIVQDNRAWQRRIAAHMETLTNHMELIAQTVQSKKRKLW